MKLSRKPSSLWIFCFIFSNVIIARPSTSAEESHDRAPANAAVTRKEANVPWRPVEREPDTKGSLIYLIRKSIDRDTYLQKCIKNNPNVVAPIEVSYLSVSLCGKGFFAKKYGSPVSYRLSTVRGMPAIDVKLFFKYIGKPEREMEALGRMSDTKECVRRYFALHGILLNLTYSQDAGLREWWNSDLTVKLEDENERASSLEWATHKTCGAKLDSNSLNGHSLCGLQIHELGHLLGLPDTYEDVKRCPERSLIRDNRYIMSGGNWLPPAVTQFHPDEIETMLSPLCGKRTAK